ncbi:RNA polymerase sigma factor [Candidatus Poribacteria bacterium]|nr:RNA polymerase sigma factor [Candidatus Poribacteria bacterium]
MVQNCTQLINKILDGDEDAFGCLVQRYQKRVHALAWRKTGDYQIAEEITQDTFLQVYKKLSTLRNPNQFDGWLYVITNRLCINWIHRYKSESQSIEDIPVEEMEESSYVQYQSEN